VIPRLRALAVVSVVVVIAAACGKKGPPLAPIVRVPAAVAAVETRRAGGEVYVTVTVPTTNIDATTPADVARIDVYGFTSRTSPGARFLEQATLVATIPVTPIPRDPSGRPLPLPPDPQRTDATQGATATVHERLTAPAFEPQTLPPPPGRRTLPPLPIAPGPPPPVQRFYTAIGFSDRGRPGPPGMIVGVPLGPVPDAPAALTGEYSPELARLRWEPSGGLLGFLLDRELPPDVPPVDDLTLFAPASATALAPGRSALAPASDAIPPGPTRYNIYREIAADPLVLPSAPRPPAWRAQLPRPLNPAPQETLTFDDPLTFDERERCYQVRAVRGDGPASVESEPSPAVCFTPVDTFPPATPTGLLAEAEPGAITLIWEPNIEEDLGGYVILRGAPGDATLTPLTTAPVPTARYVDRDLTPGTRYVYAVAAVDSRVPLGNVSDESARIEETAR
jgi:hypothetical protein